jgi:class 3 adenylate cyclase
VDEDVLQRGRPELHVLQREAVLGQHGGGRRDEQRAVAREVEAHAQRLLSSRRPVGGTVPGGVDRLDAVDSLQRRERVDDGPVCGTVGRELERAFALERPHQRIGRVEGEQPTVIHDPDPVREQSRLVHVVGREDQRHVGVAQLAQAVPDEEPRRRIETRRRLVEEEHPRRVHERAGDHHALGLPAGEEVRLVARTVEQAELLEQLIGALVALPRRHAVVRRVEDEVVADRDRPVEVAPLRHDGELLPRPHGVADDLDAADPGQPGRGPDPGREHAHRGRLPRSVRTEQPQDLSRAGSERDAVDGVHRCARIPLDELDDLDGEAGSGGGERVGGHAGIVGVGPVPAAPDAEPRQEVYVRAMDGLPSRTVEGRKTVTVLFCDLVAYTELAGRLDPEALRHVMLHFYDRAAAVIEGHGGTVEKFVGDEVMAVFGVPAVHEDDVLRAVRAAVAVHECVAELDREGDLRLEVRIGVNTGEVVTGDPASGHGFVSGDAVNVGKRLEQAAAPGEIVLGETTHRLVAHAVEATPLDPLTLKGKEEAAVAFRLESVDPAATAIPRRDDTRFVGQSKELERLRTAYQEVKSGGVRLVTVLGEPGIGKSRLARELVRSVEGQASVLVAPCPPYGEGTTFTPIREAFRQAERDDSPLDGSSYEVFAATRKLFEELAAERPLLAVFDDVHWAEETLLDLIEHLEVRLGAKPVLLLCLARPELAERRPQWLARPEAPLRLDSLSESDAYGLLDALDAPTVLRDRIAELAEGNPLFIEQLAAFAGEGGEDVALSGSIRGVLHARLDRLHPEERLVLDRAAVIGRSFSLGAVLQLIAPDEQEQAQARVFELVRRGLIRPDVAEAEDAFRFQHALIREAVYEAMPKAVRADLHETVAALLDGAAAAPAVVGFHLEQACLLRQQLGLRDAALAQRAGRILRVAAEETLSRTDAPATISLLERARELLPADDRELAAVLISLGSARVNGGDLPGAESALVEAVELAATLGDRAAELHARVELQFVRAFAESTPVEESVALATEAIPELEALGDELALARAWWLRSSGDLAACRWSARTEAIERALEHARRAHAGVEMVGTLAGLLAQALLHGPTPVDEAIERIEGLTEELGLDAPLQSAVHTSLAGLLALRGDIADARRMYRDATATYEEFGLRFRRATQSFVGAQIELLAGDPAAAERELRASSAAFEEFGALTSALTHRALLAEVVARLGGLEEAEELAQRVAAEAPADDLLAHVLSRCTLARVRAREGAAPEAAELAGEAGRLLADAEFPQLSIATLTSAAEAAAAADKNAEAERLVTEARRIASAKGARASVEQLEDVRAVMG